MKSIETNFLKRAWNIMLCESALEALVKYGATKSEYDAFKNIAKKIHNETNKEC